MDKSSLATRKRRSRIRTGRGALKVLVETADGTLGEALRALADEAEALLDAALHADSAQFSGEASARLQQLRDRFDTLTAQLDSGARSLDRYVRANPWPALAIAAALGLGAGLLLGRRR